MSFPTKNYDANRIASIAKEVSDQADALSQDRQYVLTQFNDTADRFEKSLDVAIEQANKCISRHFKCDRTRKGTGTIDFLNGFLAYDFDSTNLLELTLRMVPAPDADEESVVFRARQTDRSRKPNGDQVTTIVWFRIDHPDGNVVSTDMLARRALAWLIESQIPDVTL